MFVPMPQSTVPGQAQSSGEARAVVAHIRPGLCVTAGHHYSVVTLLRH